MKLWILGASAVAAAVGALAQDDVASGRGGLVKVAPAPADAEERDARDVETAWRQRLGDADLDRREQAFVEAVEACARDPKVRQALEGFARDERAGVELAWTARLALREAERSAGWPLALRGRFDLPRLDFARPRAFDLWLDDLALPLERLDAQRLDPSAPAPGVQSQLERFELQVGPDGVTCTVHEVVDGVETSETYTYDSIDQLLEEHPELAERIQVGGGLGNAFRLRGGALDLSDLPWTRGYGVPDVAGAMRTDVLGVVVHPLDAARAAELGVAEGVGLVVERVEPGTIAKSLRIERGHVLVALNGRELRSRDDITEVLRARASDGAVEVVLYDRWGQRRERSWKPGTAREL